MRRRDSKFLLQCMVFPAMVCSPTIAAGAGLEISVRSFDYSGSRVKAMMDAQATAASILRNTGIQIRWLSCPVRGLRSAIVADCEVDAEDATEFSLILLPERMARNITRAPGQFGMAVLDASGYSSQAYIFVNRVQDMAKGEMIAWPLILGSLMAHEHGHLLLGTNSHSRAGLMRADWRRRELNDALEGRLSFTPEQSDRIRKDVVRRVSAKRARTERPLR